MSQLCCFIVSPAPCWIRDTLVVAASPSEFATPVLLLQANSQLFAAALSNSQPFAARIQHRNRPSDGCIDVDLPFCSRIALLGLVVGAQAFLLTLRCWDDWRPVRAGEGLLLYTHVFVWTLLCYCLNVVVLRGCVPCLVRPMECCDVCLCILVWPCVCVFVYACCVAFVVVRGCVPCVVRPIVCCGVCSCILVWLCLFVRSLLNLLPKLQVIVAGNFSKYHLFIFLSVNCNKFFCSFVSLSHCMN